MSVENGMVIQGWECSVKGSLRVVTNGGSSLQFCDELEGRLGPGVVVPSKVMLWLVKPFLRFVWDDASEHHGCKGRNDNPYDEEET